MQFKTITLEKLPFFVALSLMAVLTSCGSFQYAGYDNDGIYASNDNYTDVEQPVATTSTNDSNYYKSYFAENSAELNAINGENEIFTDVDSYKGNYTEQDSLEQRQPYGGWGQANNTVTINYIDNGFGYGWNNWGWAQPWGWNAGWGYGWNNWGWNNWGWNAGWGYGWNNWGWNAGWGYGWNNWGWNAGWGYPYYGYPYHGYYGNPDRYAYMNGRRGSLMRSNNLNRGTRSNAAVSRRSYSTNRLSNAAINTRNSNSRIRSNGNSRTIGNTRTTRPTRTMRNSSSTSRSSRTGTMRNSRSSRSSSGTMRSSRSSSRSSSGTMRSSGGSSRSSSGSMRSSGSSRSSSGGSRSSSRGRG